ncbi:helix-turn-helix domain-containing protein [bacterium]|nr:helix-turn-helix domain-containing protein [bacterium]
MLPGNPEITFLTVEEVATLLRVKPYTVRKHYREGVITGIKRGKRIYFHKEAVWAYLTETSAKPSSVLRAEVEGSPDPHFDKDHRLLVLPRIRLEVHRKNALFD